SIKDMFGINTTMPRNFSLNLGADGGGLGIWGGGDITNYEGEGYEGDASFLHIGADFQTANCWLFGVALTNGGGSSEFTYGTATRDMDISLLAFSPYVRYQPSEEASIWGALSIGSGEVDITGGADNASSDLESNLFLVGGRRTVNEMGSMTLSIRGEVAMANLSTDSGDDIASGLDASVNRVRGVLEATFNMGDGGFEPFVDVGIRNDGGDGDTGTGFEVAGGIRIDSDTIDVEARAHTLATHSADEYSESGFSVIARLNPSSASGEGFSMSLSPRYGANYSNSGLIWNLEQQQMAQQRLYTDDEDPGFAVATRFAYGFAVSNDRFLVTPFIDFDKQDSASSRLLVGTELNALVKKVSSLKLEAAVGLIESTYGPTDSLIGINANFKL
ncbi:MAG: autotransporter domain-containing protein, partial [Gammaproteobacteria bacterium]|nr:autotransporter domain-containing protein [Gammaproteobacteria bacterium]